MTNEDNTADVRISNWTLATGTSRERGTVLARYQHRSAWRARNQVVIGAVRREPADVDTRSRPVQSRTLVGTGPDSPPDGLPPRAAST